MTIDDATRIRVIRAVIGMSSKSLAAHLDINPGTLTSWEKGRSTPHPAKRQALAELCREHGIAFAPSGYPFPVADIVIFKQESQNA